MKRKYEELCVLRKQVRKAFMFSLIGILLSAVVAYTVNFCKYENVMLLPITTMVCIALCGCIILKRVELYIKHVLEELEKKIR